MNEKINSGWIPKKQRLTAVFILLLSSVVLQYKYINEFPSHIHAWAQADRYAMALRFVDNGMNFFKPETYIMNHQFPDNWKTPTESSITAVDFPLHDFVPAIFMKITGNRSPWIFRLYILLYSLVGLYFLFKLTYLLTNDFYKSLFVMLFAATSPVLAYYQCGFLPTIPSLSNAIIGIFFYANYLLDKKNRHFTLSLLFLTLATLSRTTFSIPLIAVMSVEILRILGRKSKIVPKIIPVLFAISLPLAYYFYNETLRENYGSMYLNIFMPAESFSDAQRIITTAWKNWKEHYLSSFHYVILSVAIIAAIVFIASRKIKDQKKQLTFLLLIFVTYIGCIIFSILMLKQFVVHDYYFLDTFFLPILLLLILGLSFIRLSEVKKSIQISVILLVFVPLTVNAFKMQRIRRESGSWDRMAATIRNFNGAEQFLDSLHIDKNARMLVINPDSQNIPFILMNRKGYVVPNAKKQFIERTLPWNYDYIVFQNEYLISYIYPSYPELISKIEIIADNGKIVICRLSATPKSKTSRESLGLYYKTPVLEEIMSFNSEIAEGWRNIDTTSNYYLSGTKSGKLTADTEFGIAFNTSDLPALLEKNSILLFSSYLLRDQLIIAIL